MTEPVADPVPPRAARLRAFANTYDLEGDTDALSDAPALTSWLRAQGLLGSRESADENDLATARLLRDGLRAAMTAHHSGEVGAAIPELDQAVASLPLRVVFDGTEPALAPVDGGARGALAQIVIAVAECHAAGVWSRLKLCPADDCRWAFYDTSKSRTRVWCAMGVCGNRTKTRAYRARQRSG